MSGPELLATMEEIVAGYCPTEIAHKALARKLAEVVHAREQAARLACAETICELCALGNAAIHKENEVRGSWYWHDFGNLSRECFASKIWELAQPAAEPPRGHSKAEHVEEHAHKEEHVHTPGCQWGCCRCGQWKCQLGHSFEGSTAECERQWKEHAKS